VTGSGRTSRTKIRTVEQTSRTKTRKGLVGQRANSLQAGIRQFLDKGQGATRTWHRLVIASSKV
jgi:hypothetical protein